MSPPLDNRRTTHIVRRAAHDKFSDPLKIIYFRGGPQAQRPHTKRGRKASEKSERRPSFCEAAARIFSRSLGGTLGGTGGPYRPPGPGAPRRPGAQAPSRGSGASPRQRAARGSAPARGTRARARHARTRAARGYV